jgi:cytochrome d ubiquinol oxidase subunit II
VLSGLTVTAGYTALGYAYTKHKSTGPLRESAARRGAVATVVGGVLLVVLLFAVDATSAPLNLDSPGRAVAFAVLLLFAAGGAGISLVTFPWKRHSGAADILPLGGLVIATVSVFLALGVARYPVLLPPGLTVDSTAGPHSTMVFILVGIGLNMPLVLAYNVFAHRAFAGKLDTEGAHS